MRIVNFKTFTKGQLGVFCAVLLLAVVWAPSLPFESALALPGCSGASCHGLNPETMGCGTDAQTGPTKTWNYGKAQNRYSNACNAEWERTINTASWSQYAAGTIRWGSTFQYSLSVSSPAKIGANAQVYTPMKGPQDSTRNCGFTWEQGVISVPLPLSSTYCTIAD